MDNRVKGQMSKAFTDDQVDEIAAKYRAGYSVSQLAIAYSVSDSPIRNALKMRCVVLRPPGYHGRGLHHGHVVEPECLRSALDQGGRTISGIT